MGGALCAWTDEGDYIRCCCSLCRCFFFTREHLCLCMLDSVHGRNGSLMEGEKE